MGGESLMTAGAHTASCVGLHCCADAPPALVAATTTSAGATSIATAFAIALGARTASWLVAFLDLSGRVERVMKAEMRGPVVHGNEGRSGVVFIGALEQRVNALCGAPLNTICNMKHFRGLALFRAHTS